MDIQVSFDDRIPVLTLTGRFDGLGAGRFDEATHRLDRDSVFWVIDLAGVGYLSSVGVSSLVTAEKSLRARGGRLILAGLTPFVRQVLEVTRLASWMHIVTTTAGAIEVARTQVAAGTASEWRVADRVVRTRKLAGGGGSIEWWHEEARTPAAGRLLSVGLDDLGFAFGTGAFGETEADARSALGAFVCTPSFAGVLPESGVSDFMAGGASDALPIHVSTALGLHGTPALVAEITGTKSFQLLEVIDDLFDLASNETGRMPHALGLVAIAQGRDGARGLLATAVAFDAEGARLPAGAGRTLHDWPAPTLLPSGKTAIGAAVTLEGGEGVPVVSDLLQAVRPLANVNSLREVVGLDVDASLASATVWLFLPEAVTDGAEKLLQIKFDGAADWLPEWDTIVRRLYADCRLVTLTPLHGGYMSKTFRVVAYDREGRRTLPTVLKIGATALTAREEQANRDYVTRFILNNGTTLLGGAREGEWAGLRYNFLGVNGPESRLVWLREHYLNRSTPEVVRMIETLLTQVLKPWYAQPRWEQVSLYKDHTPLRLFPHLLDVAEREMGLAPDAPTFPCPELGLELPNPYHFLKHEYPRRAAESRLWYTAVCHGDLNLQNVLVDERENIYVIDFSETRPRNAVSDFARMEPILKFEMVPLDTDEDLRRLLEFEVGLTSVTHLAEPPPLRYRGEDPLVMRAHAVITLLRRAADIVTLFERDMVPYWLALLEWTYPVICYVQLSARQKRYAACSAALICRAIQQLERPAPHEA